VDKIDNPQPGSIMLLVTAGESPASMSASAAEPQVHFQVKINRRAHEWRATVRRKKIARYASFAEIHAHGGYHCRVVCFLSRRKTACGLVEHRARQPTLSKID